MLRKTTIQTDRCSPAFPAVLLKNSQDTDSRKGPTIDEILKKCIQFAITQTPKPATEVMKLCHWSPQGWTLEDPTLNGVSNRGRLEQMTSLQGKIKKRGTRK